ncbi:protein transport protein Sec24-like [Hibiscus syriacus]|uniref:Protein transport protein Sec24-like n=1 Tax=Hibiscus syriacus TaxID=106335 RepID=A0A6A2Z9A4_HIBSY|nr:protein transport protein Sec24-like [Hibiscus syriacus]
MKSGSFSVDGVPASITKVSQTTATAVSARSPRLLPTRDSSSAAAGMPLPKASMLILRAAFLFTLLTLSVLMLYTVTDSVRFLRFPSASTFVRIFPSYLNYVPSPDPMKRLEETLRNASTGNKTVILTTLNDAWASTNSVVDLFLKSFMLGEGTHWLLNHLEIIVLDEKAYNCCQVVHKHCFSLVTEDVDFQQEAYFMTPNYLKMMWRRIDFLRSVLDLGYSFVFTLDILPKDSLLW